MIKTYNFSQNDILVWLKKLLFWGDSYYPVFAFFDDNKVDYPQKAFKKSFFASQKSFDIEKAFGLYNTHDLVGVLSYDYKNKVEKLNSENVAIIDLPESVFFIPELKIYFDIDSIQIEAENPDYIFDSINSIVINFETNRKVEVIAQTSKEEYTESIKSIQNHIVEGDIYEMNYCMAFSFEAVEWNPIVGFFDLMKKSPMPFSTFFKAKDNYLLCASPERFLKKEKMQLIAQPIKGTIKRGVDSKEDEILKRQLFSSDKERAENLMIVDLMRNDLSKISKTGSVKVNELFGVYAFPKVFQMISTVSSVSQENVRLRELFHATFPMGSMTGAPKIKCMELIEKYENFKRSWFSGTVGYVMKNGDMDLNVIIRSILFDKKSQKGYFAVGSAITFDADASYEYEECLLKASAIMEVLSFQETSKN
ncbi:anthranilate synthase component I family protein [Belliella sp. DSM 107340]|uniref:Anthranilate synthase component I family protein n=1 Tax=Belliella calami TaxID=2923436 RepID=A0ABS9UKJ6_9BACT|nr:anthranilate synthase component I family protein [Belliella calami]MCH7397136.1 anthranilate synthase component I family protein [Belliella calami]